MKDLEKFLTDLPKPGAEVPAFRNQLRRELLSAARAESRPRLGLVLGLTGSLATGLALLLLLFVARPAIPAGIHAALTGRPAPEADAISLEQLLERARTPAAADRAFVEDWTARQIQPVSVRSMEAETMYNVRQFELTDGQRMLVFTELGREGTRPEVVRAAAPKELY